ncbi:hypothetical protein [Desulfurococcus mucosus]|uniref:Uncharacterized protein n=1 Tax=Desulfurococcus mucosus (strain ATCC 35584 / DSM 2162 / JCM 9187 / O7/1) TaxID=765177 RepID=E8R800_DESM0|nr:hypothetical protein [Desulfurococcus mucosus]ADV64626.1 hypothetical protein Desmu_0307 [Desulfurococcus mucosus DSM 2162]
MKTWIPGTAKWLAYSVGAGLVAVVLLRGFSTYIAVDLAVLTAGIVVFTLLFPYHLSTDVTGRRVLPRGSGEISLFVSAYLPVLALYVLLLLGYGGSMTATVGGLLAPLIVVPGLLVVGLMLHYGLYRPVAGVPARIIVTAVVLLVDAVIWMCILLPAGLYVLGALEFSRLYLGAVLQQEPVAVALLLIPPASLVLAAVDLARYRGRGYMVAVGFGVPAYRRLLVSRVFKRLASSHVINVPHEVYLDVSSFLQHSYS